MATPTNVQMPMSPPAIRATARSPVRPFQNKTYRSISLSQVETKEYRRHSSQSRLESDVFTSPLKTFQIGFPTELEPGDKSGDGSSVIESPKGEKTQSPKTTLQGVHKIILSGVSTVEFLHTKDLQASQDSQPTIVDAFGVRAKESQHPAIKMLAPKCLYRVEYRDENDVLVGEKEGNSPAEVKVPKRDEAVIEVITTFGVKRKSQSDKVDFDPERTKTIDLGTKVRINSPILTNALRAVVTYYPGESLLEEPLVFSSPYRLLFYYRKDLELYKNNHPETHSPEYREECNQHIDILLDFLHQCHDGNVDLEETRNQQQPPMCTYEYLWTVFKPGVDIYARESMAPFNSPRSVHVVSSVLGGPIGPNILPYRIKIWHIRSDGQTLRRCPAVVEISPFDGEKEIRSLDVLPMDFLEEAERKALEERFIARGKRYHEYTSISHQHFHGYTMWTPRSLFDVEVIIDTAEFYYDSPYLAYASLDTLDEDEDKSIGVSGCGCATCRKTKNMQGKVKFSGYDRIPLKTSATTTGLSDHQYLLCSQEIFGYALKHRAWHLLDMDAITDIKFDKDAINDLILEPEENKGLLKALAKRYAQKPDDIHLLPPTIQNGVTVVQKSPESWAADSAKEKGEGQIILLHGPPGVGKTCTAENVAEFTERPLLSLSCSDIGTEAKDVEKNLKRWMEKGRRWGAILLIDEADVYLEERTPQGLERNGLVSVFLRNLEYYQGILFLTTNRVGVFDEAFTSRIHITMWYPGFDDARRIKVWKGMIARLQRERKDIKIPYDLNKYIERDEDLKKVEWNGREIRNAFQTVVALAEFQATEEKTREIEIKVEYLDQVVKMSRRFKDYLSTMPDGNVAKKALRYGKRNDEFNSS